MICHSARVKREPERFDAPFVPLSDYRAQLGESPAWSESHNAIWWVDISGCKLLRTDLSGDTTDWHTDEHPGFVQCVGEAIYVGMQSGIFRFCPARASFEKLVALNLPDQRFNDACTDMQGRIWAGTMDLENKKDNGVLFLFDPRTRILTPKITGFRTINGLAWDQANQRLFYSDSHPTVQTVWTRKIASGDQMAEREVFARFNDLAGRPDGAAIDASGHYWIAGVGGSALYRFAPNGDLGAICLVPLESPTKPAFLATSDNAIVLTSFADNAAGGRLGVWRDPLNMSLREGRNQ